MKKIIILLLLPFLANAQESQSSILKFSSASLFGGAGFNGSVPATINDFSKLSDKSTLLQSDFSKFESDNLYDNYLSYTAVYLNFDINNDGKFFKHKSLRVGASFAENTPFRLTYSREELHRIDTLTSVSSGRQTFVDSVYGEAYDFEYSQQLIFLNAAYLIHTNPESRFSFYTGLEIAVGFSLSNQSRFEYTEYQEYEDDFNGQIDDDLNEKDKSFSESYRNKSGFALMAGIPIGIDFRLGNRREFWKKCHLIGEYKPGFSILSIREVSTLSNVALMGSGGVRYEF